MTKLTLFLVVIACVALTVFGQATIPCTYTDPSTGFSYDLSPLANSTVDYCVKVPTGTDNITTEGYQIVLNVCRPIKDQMCAPQGGNIDACIEWPIPNPKYANALGQTTATYLEQAQSTIGVTMLYNGFTSNMQINFLCNPSRGTGQPYYVTKPTSTQFLLQWESTYACAKAGNKSRIFCDCEKADMTLCQNSSCPSDVDDFCTEACTQFGGVQNSTNNYCNYNTSSDICVNN